MTFQLPCLLACGLIILLMRSIIICLLQLLMSLPLHHQRVHASPCADVLQCCLLLVLALLRDAASLAVSLSRLYCMHCRARSQAHVAMQQLRQHSKRSGSGQQLSLMAHPICIYPIAADRQRRNIFDCHSRCTCSFSIVHIAPC